MRVGCFPARRPGLCGRVMAYRLPGDRRRGRPIGSSVGNVLERNAVRVSGVPGGRPIVFAHGFGCDQGMWRFVAPDFEVDHRVVLFDQVGSGNSDLSAYDPDKYGSLRGYAADLVEICRELELTDVVFVGHSVSAMIGVLAFASRRRSCSARW